jgi:hypothetical protein
MAEDWKARLREAQGDVFERLPEARKLREKLLSIGGEEVNVRGVPPYELARLVKRGEMWPGKGSKFVRMEPIRCHQNSLALWEAGKGDIANGFALSPDGLWREHSWVVSGDRVIETTVRRVAYYGARLSKAEIIEEYEY